MNSILAANALKDAVAAHKAIKRWLDWCDGLHAAKIAAGLYTEGGQDLFDRDRAGWITLSISVERAYMTSNKRPPMPSKTRKYQMYSDIYRASDLAGVPAAPGSINDMVGVALAIAKVSVALLVAAG
jgi:hypothetical protein